MGKKVEELGEAAINKLFAVTNKAISRASKKKLGRSRESKAKQGDDNKKNDKETRRQIRDIHTQISKERKDLNFMLDQYSPLMFDEIQIRENKDRLEQLMCKADALVLDQLKALG